MAYLLRVQPERSMPPAPVRAPVKPAPPKAVDWSKYTDLHLTVGLIDERIRVTLQDFETLQVHALLAAEPCFIVVSRKESEATLILRGQESIRVFRTNADPAKKLPLARVFTVETLQRRMLEKDAAQAQT